MNELLKRIYKNHKKYINFVKSYGIIFDSEDVVQDMYLKVYNYGNLENLKNQDDKKLNGYVYRVLLTLIATHFNRETTEKQKVCLPSEIKESEEMLAYEKFEKKIDDVLNTLHWYDKMLFNIYRYKRVSMRKLSKDTGISLTSIFMTIKKVKSKLKEELSDDYKDYINGDYELL